MIIEEPPASPPLLDRFCAAHQLPQGFAASARDYYLPLIEKILVESRTPPCVVGVSGSQGSGKSTLADLISWMATGQGWNTVVLSIDDFYLSQTQRQKLAADLHPLLRTRGVPGTHDTDLLRQTIADLKGLGSGASLALPRFDKLADNPLPRNQRTAVTGPVDLIVFEGWCLGARPQAEAELEVPLNDLERREDPDRSWRRWVNERLRLDYQDIWREIDILVCLQAPDFALVLDWRYQQEQQLVRHSNGAKAPMTLEQVQRFVQHYQRITQDNLQRLPEVADVTFYLDSEHQVCRSRYRHV